MRRMAFLVLLALVLLLAACGGQSGPKSGDDTAMGDAAAGEALFVQPLLGNQAGCSSCHSLEPGVTLVGPSMAQIGTAAETRVPDQSAAEYLRLSIVAPDDFVVAGFAENLMPATYGNELTEEEISNLVSFLLAQK